MPDTENHPDTIITPGRAREALRCIADLTAPVPTDHWAIVTLSEVLRQFEEAHRGEKAHEQTSCPGCQVARFIIPFTTDHLAHCPGHPAVRRARAVLDAIRLAPEVVRSLRLEPVTLDPARLEAIDELAASEVARWKGGWTFLRDASWLRHSIEILNGPGRKEYPNQVGGHVAELEKAIEAWRRIVHRGSDPCPYCGAVVSLDEVIGHLLRCERHPARLLADDAFAALAASLGKAGADALVKLVEERNDQVDGLRALILACNTFDGDLGWNGEESYARGYVEYAFERAVAAASQRAGVGDPEYRPNLEPVAEAASGPDFARRIWRALHRVTADGPTPGSHAGMDEDGALLRATYQEMLRLHEQLSGEQECAACGRHGIFTHNAVRHVSECLLHPAVARQRAAAAEMEVARAVLKEKRPGQALPETARDRRAPIRRLFPSAWWRSEADRRKRAKTYFEPHTNGPLAFLLSPEQRAKYPTIVGGYRDELVGALSAWQRLKIAERGECPWCGEAAPLEALLRHVLTCTAHPAAHGASVLESSLTMAGIDPPGVATRLRREADRARIATVRLLECTESFRGSFGDDDRGRATISRSLEPAWGWERHVALKALKDLEATPYPAIEQYAWLCARWAIFVPKGDGKTWASSVVVPPPTSIGAGWLPLLDALFADLRELGWRHHVLSSATVEHGALALSLHGMTPALQARVEQARTESERICERCGAAGLVRAATEGAMRTRCDECEAAETLH
jgi:hypothetical protein